MGEIETSLEETLNGLTYIGDIDSATLTAIRVSARELDREFRTTLMTEYRRQLDAIKAMGQTGEEDEEDDLLSPM